MNNFEQFNLLSENEILEELKKVSSNFDIFDFEKNSQPTNYLPLFKKYHSTDSITFFGGTFNPMHLGHIECIKLCPEKNIVLILDRNPQKELRLINYKNELGTILNEIKDLAISLYPGFWIQNNSNPTSSWIKSVKAKEKNLLMGDDSFIKFFSWIKPDLILAELTKIYVVPRNHELKDLTEIQNKCLTINPNLKIIYLSNHDYQSLSSTEIRKKSN